MPTPPWVNEPNFFSPEQNGTEFKRIFLDWNYRDPNAMFPNLQQERIVNYPLRVIMHGMEGTTQTLQHAGWSVSMKQDVKGESIQLAMHHEQLKLFAISAPVSLNFMQLAYRPEDFSRLLNRVVFIIDRLATRMEVIVHGGPLLQGGFAAYSPVDCNPYFESMTRKSIEDFMIFRPLNHSKNVIVDPNDVPGLMDMILKAQSPMQEEIRARQRSRENMAYVIDAGLMPSQTIHAQIITVAA